MKRSLSLSFSQYDWNWTIQRVRQRNMLMVYHISGPKRTVCIQPDGCLSCWLQVSFLRSFSSRKVYTRRQHTYIKRGFIRATESYVNSQHTHTHTRDSRSVGSTQQQLAGTIRFLSSIQLRNAPKPLAAIHLYLFLSLSSAPFLFRSPCVYTILDSWCAVML
jgi:hypothetical protein